MSTALQKQRVRCSEPGADSDLPEGWTTSPLGSILTVSYGKGLKQANREPGQISVYGSNGVVGKHKLPLTGGPTIIIGRKGTIGAVHFSFEACWPIDTTYYVDNFRGLDPAYLTFALRGMGLGEFDTSTAIPGLNRDELYSQEIRLAPVAEQARIVAKIEELLAEVNAVRARLAKVAQILKRFRQSVLAAACSGRLTEGWRERHPHLESTAVLLQRVRTERKMRWNNGKRNYEEPALPENEGLPDLPTIWDYTTLDQLLSGPLANGRSVPDREGGFPVLRLTALKNGLIDLTERKSGAWTAAEARRFLVMKGDFLVSRGNGSLSLVGRGGLVVENPDPVAYPDTLIRVRLCNGAEGRYLRIAWESDVLRKQIESAAHTTAGIHKVSQKDLARFAVPLPPLGEQREIVRRVEALFKLADEIEKQVNAAAKRSDKLTQAILAKAFRGELVPTEAELARREGRAYETAAELIARTEAEREAARLPERANRQPRWPRKNAS